MRPPGSSINPFNSEPGLPWEDPVEPVVRHAPPDDVPVLTVTELTRRIRGLIEGKFGQITVEGELSNVRRPPSGHCYFTIKDEGAQIRAVTWRSDVGRLAFSPRDGMRVRAHGTLSVYDRDGTYQIVVRRLEEWGKGTLQAAFEALKKTLAAEGLFDPDRKRKLPLLPRCIGVVTSPSGAAIRDILKVLERRFPNLHVIIAPARVQGDGAGRDIAEAIDLLNRHGGIDVMIVGRGGGSLEDLWCFNEEVVARAVARSEIPVISAVGHETDFTICDFVADMRAPTPSAAAEIVVGRKDEFLERLATRSQALTRVLKQALLQARHRVRAAARSYVFREPGNAARVYRHRLERLDERAGRAMERRMGDGRQRADDLSGKLFRSLEAVMTARVQQVAGLERQLTAYNPLAVLKRGYSITFGPDGRAVRTAAEVGKGDRVVTRVGSGSFTSEVIDLKRKGAANEQETN